MRHVDRRVRVLLAFTPSEDMVEIEDASGNTNTLPFSFSLQDIIIVREMLNRRPINDDQNPDILWKKVNNDLFMVPVEGKRLRASLSGSVESKTVELEKLLLTDAAAAESHVLEESSRYSRTFPGGLLVKCDPAVLAESSSHCRISWVPSCELNDHKSVCYAADIRFSYRPEIGQQSGRAFVVPPRLEDFFVDVMGPKSN